MELLIVRLLTVMFFVIAIVSCIGILWIILYVRGKTRQRRSIREEILKTKANLLSQGRWFPVNYCTEALFRKLPLVGFLWEAIGILFISNTQIIFFGKSLSGENFEAEFEVENFKVRWIGRQKRKWWSSRMSYWLEIDSRDEKYYFTFDTGMFVFGSKTKTRQICNELIRVCGIMTEIKDDSKIGRRPVLITILCILGFLTFALVFLAMAIIPKKTIIREIQHYGLVPALILILTFILIFAGFIGYWKMRKWGLYLHLTAIIIDIGRCYLLTNETYGILGCLVSILIIGIGAAYFKRMT